MSMEATFFYNNIVDYAKRWRRRDDENCNKSQEIFEMRKKKQ